jgi:hypothetical protein
MSAIEVEIPEVASSAFEELMRMRREQPMRLAGLLAVRRALRGRRWLNRHAPCDWHRNLFDVLPNGTASFRAHTNYDNENVLALAFEYDASLANQYGYVTYPTVARHHRLTSRHAAALGFSESTFRRRNGEVVVKDVMLDEAWKSLLMRMPSSTRIAYRHETDIDRRFRELGSFMEDEPGTPNIFWNFIRSLWPWSK